MCVVDNRLKFTDPDFCLNNTAVFVFTLAKHLVRGGKLYE